MNTVIGKAALICSDCAAYDDYREDGTYIKHLMAVLGVELFVLDAISNTMPEKLFDSQK